MQTEPISRITNEKKDKAKDVHYGKAKLQKEGIFFFLHLFARDVLVMKKLEIEKTKPTFNISTFKTIM